MTRYSWIAFAIFLMPCCASANDSVARVSAGGLVLEKTDDIEMVSEVLEISTARIRVTYHFLNTSDHDIKTTVAFPMPAFDNGARYSETRRNQKPLDSFRIYVNGEPVPVQKNRALLFGNTDMTSKLREIGLTDNQIFDPKFTCLDIEPDQQESKDCVLTEKQIKALKNLPDNIGTMRIKETAYWEQTFPSKKDIEIAHEYKPFVGFNYAFEESSSQNKAACLDQSTRKLIAKRLEDNPSIAIRDVEYILGTGRNWKGPIKSFRLILKKKDPDEVVSLCFPGKPKQTSPTTLEFTQTDFTPQDSLTVLFYDFHYDYKNEN